MKQEKHSENSTSDKQQTSRSQIDPKALRVGTLGHCPLAMSLVGQVISNEQIFHLPQNLEQILEFNTPPETAFLTIHENTSLPLAEVAQLLRAQYPELPIFYSATKESTYKKDLLQKNGFTDVFRLPFESALLLEALRARVDDLTSGRVRLFKPIFITDLQPGTELGFDTYVYLPLNRKYIKLSAKGKALDHKQVDKIIEKQVQTLFVRNDEMNEFLKYTVDQLKALGQSDMSYTARQTKCASTIRNLMSSILGGSEETDSFTNGATLVKNCQEMITQFFGAESSTTNLMNRIQQLTGRTQSNNYDRIAVISGLAFLFSIGTGIGDPKDMAVAGLLHDLGLSELPPEVQGKSLQDLPVALQIEYRKHPELTIEMIRRRKMTVSENVINAILQHHERFAGGGFPKGLAYDRVTPEAQLLAMTIRFADLVSLSEGQKHFTPKLATEQLYQENRASTTRPFDPLLLDRFAKAAA